MRTKGGKVGLLLKNIPFIQGSVIPLDILLDKEIKALELNNLLKVIDNKQ